MVFSLRLSNGLMVCSLTLALAASASCVAQAQTASDPKASSVEVYTGQAATSSPDTEGVLPEGMKWNRPLKAGDLALPKDDRTTQKKTTQKAVAPTLPVGDLNPPVIGSQGGQATPPQISGGRSSSSNLMLMQGMKNALQQSGQNPDIPKADNLTPTSAASSGGAVLQAPILPKAAAPAAADSGVAYAPGQEPKALASSGSAASAAAVVAPSLDASAPVASSGEAPKATDMADAPPTLSAVVDGDVPAPTATAASATTDLPAPNTLVAPAGAVASAPTAEASKKNDKSSSSGLSSFISSIFGDSVEDKAKKDGASADVAENGEAKADEASIDCSPNVIKWTRTCQEAGYPSYFKGQIDGETRTICPGGDSREVWVSNTCSASFVKQPAATANAETSAAPVAAAAASVGESETNEQTDGACGALNGLASSAAPVGDLCQHGRPTSVAGDGPWHWSCQGLHGGMTVSCAAPVGAQPTSTSGAKSAAGKGGVAAASALESGQCGEATQGANETAPTTDLCSKGTPSRVSGNGPWTWACSGSNGGQAAACTARRKTDGVCGAATSDSADGMPSRDLCVAGYASAVTGNGPWNWTCSGLYGGAAATCTAEPRVDAVCGSASTLGHRDRPTDSLCYAGKSSSVEGNGPWSWTCNGDHGGATVACRASVLTDGACGAANGNQYMQAPTKGLCAKGRSSLVTGQGPWNWTCSGVDGGDTVGCAASLGTTESLKNAVACGEATEMLALSKPSSSLCVAGQPSEVTGVGPWNWTCADEAGHTASCTTLSQSDGTCGSATSTPSASAPRSGLCESGMPSEVEADRSHDKWAWKCDGIMGGASSSCAAPMVASSVAPTSSLGSAPTELAAPAEMSAVAAPVAPRAAATCGSAAARSTMERPAEDELCASGNASKVKGNGPWSWSCQAGGKKGPSVSCESFKIVDAACGTSNGSMQKSSPVAGLCASGSATEVHGAGPWMWSCVGAGGGNSVSCSALSQLQTKVDGLCGEAANSTSVNEPSNNLCDSGTPSTVYGDGPWTWTCSGLNGGIASTCKANKNTPKAPPPPGPTVNGLCGPSNGVPHNEAPIEGLCSTGTVTALSGEGPWTWNCLGMNGGMTVSCVAPLTPPDPIVGVCGSASGVPTLTQPKSALCSAGISSAVSGRGPWTWSCSGTNGGGAVSCVAPVAGRGAGAALPSLSTPSLGRDEPATPKASPAGLVTPTLPTSELGPTKGDAIPNRKYAKASSKKTKNLAETAVPESSSTETLDAPDEAPLLPDGTEALNPPPVRDTLKPAAGLKSPVIDSDGKPIPGARLVLEPDVSSIGFASGSDQLDKSAASILDKVAAILKQHSDARITLVAYASTAVDRAPREARRLSLNRALSIRDFLVGKGIPSGRVDLRPMGANVSSGDMDRVDIRLN